MARRTRTKEEAETSLRSQDDVGQRIRRARQLASLTLQDVSSRSGVSVSALSKIETGRVAVKFATLQKLCESLDLSLSQLQASAGVQAVSGARVISRADEAVHHDVGVYDYAIQCSELIRKGMFPTLIAVKARSLQEFEEWNRHSGEEFIYVLQGGIELHFENYEPAILKPGDSAYYDSGLGHAFIKRGRGDALVLSVSLADRPATSEGRFTPTGARVPSPAKAVGYPAQVAGINNR